MAEKQQFKNDFILFNKNISIAKNLGGIVKICSHCAAYESTGCVRVLWVHSTEVSWFMAQHEPMPQTEHCSCAPRKLTKLDGSVFIIKSSAYIMFMV